MKSAIRVLLLVCVGFGSAQAQLKVDFGVAASPVASGYQAYTATHEVGNTFTARSFGAFGTTITVALTWPSSAADTAKQMFDRTTDTRYAYTGEHGDLLRDWTGTDGRVANANPLVVTLSGLPRGAYSWLSYHHDGIDQTGVFSVTVKGASGTATTVDLPITNSAGGDAVTNFASVSTFTTEFTSNGTDDVALEFTVTSDTANVATAFFVMNAFEIEMLTALNLANNPSPSDQQTDVLRDSVLSWTPGHYAATHDVYLGTTFEDVNDASRAAPAGVLVSQAQDANAYDAPGVLQYGQTYYWRIDEVNAPPSSTIFKGTVWSFTVEPVSSPVTGILATASSASKDMGPEKTVDGSGLNADGRHSTASTDMWVTAKGTTFPAWIQYELPSLQKLDKMLAWNSNQTLEVILGLSAKDVKIEVSTDGEAWTTLGDFEFVAAPGSGDCTADTVVDFGGIAARFVKLTITSNWGGILAQSGLSEVRFYAIPVVAREPQPAPDATDVNPQVEFTWRAGREAGSHEVYVGTAPNALTLAGTATTPSFAPADLSLETTYYWKVDEVNAAETPSTWAGDVWTFTTSDFLVVDDMESYNDTTNKMFDVWVDGFDTTTNGALVGYDESANGTFGETTILHGGKQSMPLRYGQNSATTSEATCTFDAAQNWTIADVKTLVLYFRGAATNDAGQLYLKINGTKVDYSGGSTSVAIALWKQWNIDLASVSGVNFKAVKTVTLGVSGSGKGTLYIDDIRLYKTAPAVIAPVDPGTTGLVSSFAMEGGKVLDSVSGITGTPTNVMFDASMTTGFGQAAQFNGTSAYVDLGADYWTKVISKLSSCTFAVWVNYSGAGGTWQRVLDFGCGTSVYVFLSTGSGTAGIPRFAVKTDVPNSGSTDAGFIETGVNASSALTVGWHHLAGVVDATGGAAGNPVLYLYIDGVRAGGPSAARLPKDMVLQTGTPWQMWLGRSQWTADPYFSGAIDDLKVFNRALSEGEIRYLAGDR